LSEIRKGALVRRATRVGFLNLGVQHSRGKTHVWNPNKVSTCVVDLDENDSFPFMRILEATQEFVQHNSICIFAFGIGLCENMSTHFPSPAKNVEPASGRSSHDTK